MSKSTLQDKLKASIQQPASPRSRTARPAAAKTEVPEAAASTATTEKQATTTTPKTATPAPASKPAQPKKTYLNDDRVWPD